MSDQPFRVVVEVVTPEIVNRLQEDNAALRKDLQQLQAQHNALHATVYRLLDRLSDLQRQLRDKK